MSDTIQNVTGIVTLILMVLFFWVEIRRPFQLIGASEGKYPLPEDPHRSKTISLSMEKPEFVVRAVPRVGGTFEEISAFFQRTPTIFERARPRFRLCPAIHMYRQMLSV